MALRGAIMCDLVFTVFFPFSFSSPRPTPTSSFSAPSCSGSLPSPASSLLPGGGGGAAEVAGSKAVPALPESGQSEPEPPEAEGGAKAAGNNPLPGARQAGLEWEPLRAELGFRCETLAGSHVDPPPQLESARVGQGPKGGADLCQPLSASCAGPFPLPERWREAEASQEAGEGSAVSQPDVLSHLSRTPATTPVRFPVEKGL